VKVTTYLKTVGNACGTVQRKNGNWGELCPRQWKKKVFR
jgi:hypothetical protein